MRFMPTVENNRQAGFTLIEVLIIAPIVLLTIAAFIGIIIALTGQVLVARTDNTIAYRTQSALNTIEQDIRVSRTFLATNSVTLATPQGSGDNTTAFVNVASGSTPVLILNAVTTTDTTQAKDRRPIYLANAPFSCGDANVNQNQLLTYNIVYFVKNNALWRRTVMPANYTTAACNSTTIRQQPSCSIGQTNAFCKTQDMKVLDGVGASGLAIDYYVAANSTTADTTAVNASLPNADRQTALNSLATAKVSLSASQAVAGKTSAYSGAVRATRLTQTPL